MTGLCTVTVLFTYFEAVTMYHSLLKRMQLFGSSWQTGVRKGQPVQDFQKQKNPSLNPHPLPSQPLITQTLREWLCAVYGAGLRHLCCLLFFSLPWSSVMSGGLHLDPPPSPFSPLHLHHFQPLPPAVIGSKGAGHYQALTPPPSSHSPHPPPLLLTIQLFWSDFLRFGAGADSEYSACVYACVQLLGKSTETHMTYSNTNLPNSQPLPTPSHASAFLPLLIRFQMVFVWGCLRILIRILTVYRHKHVCLSLFMNIYL